MNYSKMNMLSKLGREFVRDQVRDTGLSDTEHAICTFLCFHENISQDFISETLLFDKTTVAKALAALESKGLIERRQNEQNRRKNVIRISESGRLCVAESVDIYDKWLDDVCSCLNESEQQQLNDYFDRIMTHALELRQEKSHNKEIS